MELAHYTIKTDTFEGPFDVLLELIKKRKLFINEISLSQVTDEYLEHVRSLDQKSLSYVTSFLVIAAALILIKSKSLLPQLQLTDDEEEEIEDLERRLRLYEVFKDAAEYVACRYGGVVLYPRGATKTEAAPVFVPDDSITIETMHEIAQELVRVLPDPEPEKPEVSVHRAVTIEEMLDNLTDRISKATELSFGKFSHSVASGKQGREQKVFVIVSFLAMLELVRGGIMDAVQQSDTGDITLVKN